MHSVFCAPWHTQEERKKIPKITDSEMQFRLFIGFSNLKKVDAILI